MWNFGNYMYITHSPTLEEIRRKVHLSRDRRLKINPCDLICPYCTGAFIELPTLGRHVRTNTCKYEEGDEVIAGDIHGE